MKPGWYAMKRGAHDHPLFYKKPERFFVWSWLLANAAWSETTQDVHGHTVKIKRGQICTTQREIEKATGVGRQIIRTLLKDLEANHALTQGLTHQSTQAKTIITICNYNKYQASKKSDNPDENRDLTTIQPTKEQINNINNSSNEEAALSAPVQVSISATAVWNSGKPFLASLGVSNPGQMIGKWLKSNSPAEILAAFESAQKIGTQDPIPYIEKVLRGEKPKAANMLADAFKSMEAQNAT